MYSSTLPNDLFIILDADYISGKLTESSDDSLSGLSTGIDMVLL